jgi:hypothetical protein
MTRTVKDSPGNLCIYPSFNKCRESIVQVNVL